MVAFKFEDKHWDQTLPPKPIGDLRFRHLFKTEDWQTLPLPVRQRFGRRVAIGDAIIYRGQVEFNHINRWGRLLNIPLRLLGAPMPLDRHNEGAAAIVTVTEAPNDSQIWMRQYARRNTKKAFPQVIQSAKHFRGPTGIEEHIGKGIGMTLRPCVENRELVFRAEDIFWDIGPKTKKVRLKLPRWLGPSELRAGHEELGDGAFAFTLRLKHKWFGTLVDQRVRFVDDLTPPDANMES